MLRFFSVRHIIPTLRDVTNQQNDRRVSFCFLLLTQNWSFLQEFSPEFPTANYLVLRKKKKVSQMLRNLSYLKTLKSSNNNLMLQHPVKKQYFALYGHIIFTWVLSFLQFLFFLSFCCCSVQQFPEAAADQPTSYLLSCCGCGVLCTFNTTIVRSTLFYLTNLKLQLSTRNPPNSLRSPRPSVACGLLRTPELGRPLGGRSGLKKIPCYRPWCESPSHSHNL